MNDAERRAFATPPAAGELDGIDLALLDPSDPDERRLLILAEHPELRQAVRGGRDELHLAGGTVSPDLHITMHEIVANQLWEDQPPETWQTARRLLAAGYERHEILHMLASVVSNDVFEVLREGKVYDPAKTIAGLAALPESWEQQRENIPAERHMNRAERRAVQRRHRR